MRSPQVQLRSSVADRISEWVGIMLLICIWVVACWAYYSLPAVVATHFDAAGNVDAYGSKATLWLLPCIATIVYVGLTVLSHYPHVFNYPVQITGHNARRQYSIAVRMLRWLKLAIVVALILVLIMTWHTGRQGFARPQAWLLPLILVLVLGPVILAVVQMCKKA